jgi:hypothetical protein
VSGISYPVDRSFVVKLKQDESSVPLTIKGRVEHVVSGRAERFSSATELEAKMQILLPKERDNE